MQQLRSYKVWIAIVIVAIVLATFVNNFSSFSRDNTIVADIPVNATIDQGTKLIFNVENASTIASVSALVYGQIEFCEELEEIQRPGLICMGPKTFTVSVYLNNVGSTAASRSFSLEPLTGTKAPIRETFFRFPIESLRNGENEIALLPLTPRFIQNVKIMATYK